MKRKRGQPKKTSAGLGKQNPKPKPKSKLVQEVAAQDTVSNDGASLLNSQEKLGRKRGQPKKTSAGLGKQNPKPKPKSKLVQEVAAQDTVSNDGASLLNSQEKLGRKRGQPKKTSGGLGKQNPKPKPKSKLVQEVAAQDTVSNDGASLLNSQEKLALDDLVKACVVELESQNGTTRSRSQRIAQKKRVVNGTVGDSVKSFDEPSVFATLSKRAGGGKTKSSRGLASCNMEPSLKGDVLLNGSTLSKEQKRARSKLTKSSRGYASSSASDRGYNADLAPDGLTRQQESYVPYKDPGHKEQELIASLKVIRKVMEMDAAEPFNVPVDAVALNIPDYFNIIDTPMDFGTICKNLERGVKYMNSKDVLKDVQLIWDNCTKYNKKGHYILELMKRVKENFTRLWTEARLPSEPEEEIIGYSTLNPPNFSTSSLHGCRNPLSSIVQFARHQQHDQTGVDGLQPHQSSLSYNQSHQHFQGPWHHQGSSVPQFSAQPHSYQNVGGTVELDDYPTHQQNRQTHWSHRLQQQQLSLSGSHTQQRSCCPPISQQVQHYHQQAGRFNPYDEPLHIPQESTMWATPYGHQCPSGYMEDNRSHPRKMTQNQLGSIQPQHHQPTVNQFEPSSVPLQPSQPVACAAGANAGDTHSSPPAESMIRYVPRAMKRSLDPKSNLNHQQQDEILPSHKKLHQTPSSPCDQQHNPEQGTHEDNVNSSPLNPHCSPLLLSPEPNNSETDSPEPNNSETDSPEPTSSESDSADNTYSPPVEESMRRRTRSATRPSVGTNDSAGCQEKYSSSSKKGRRPTQFEELWNMKGKITIATNDLGQPVGPDTDKLSYFIGTIGRNGHLAPLNYAQWRAVPDENKEKMWQLVQAKFDIDPKSYAWVMKSIGNRWRNWKCLLKTARYNTHDTDEERLADIDERVIPEQWHILVKYWNSEESQKRSSISKANRAQCKFLHTTGPKSYAQLREEERAKRPDGKEPTKADFFILTRTRKDGRIVNDETSKVISQLREKAAEHQGTTEVSTIEDDVFFEVMGEENPPRSHTRVLVPTPSDIGLMLRSREEAIKTAAEASKEVREMKEKMMSMEQTCAQMASQMATMMSMMSTMHEKLPDKHVVSNPSVSPPEPQQAMAAAEVSGGSVRSQKEQAHVGRKRKKNKAIAKA